jgi:hypothetical protein
MAFNFLPGVQTNTVDGGLVARTIPTSKSVLVIGTSATGPTDPFQVVDRSAAAAAYGFTGNLLRAMEEVSAYSDNVLLYRMGTSPMTLNGVGVNYSATVATTNVAVTSNVATITTGTPHGAVAGNTVLIAGFTTHSVLNGLWVVISATSTTFTFAVTTSNIVSVADATGTVALQTSAGFNISFGTVQSTAQTDYTIWYKNGVLSVWLSGNLVYTNQSGAAVDLANISLSNYLLGSMLGLQFGSGATPTLATAITVQAAAALAGTAPTPPPVLTQPVTGVGLTGRQTYVALAKALDLLQIFPVDEVYCPAALIDQANVAYYVAADTTTVANSPAANPDALDWIKVTTSAAGVKTYQWANDSLDSNGAVVTPMTGVTTPAQRIAAGFYEAQFGYLLANFCLTQTTLANGCIAFIGTSNPVSFRLTDTRTWVGFLPTYDPVLGTATAPGSGLLGIPVLSGTTAAKLNPLCLDFANGFRKDGFFQTNENQYDGTLVTDINSNPVDIGAYIHVVADHAILSNGYLASYEGNLAGVVAGFCSNVDEKQGLTNKPLNVIQLWKPALSQMDSLTQVGVNVLRFKGLNQSPVLLHDITAATSASDYTNLVRQRIKFKLIQVLQQQADKFIGGTSIDGLQLTALKTALEAAVIKMQKRGYVSYVDFNITSSQAQQRLGKARIDVKFSPANELIQLQAFLGIKK